MTHPFVRPLIGTLAASTIAAAAVLPAQAADPLTWTQQAPTTAPASRSYFAMAYDSTSARTVMFGGQLANGTSTNETWEWDGSNWTLKQPATSPSARNGETMVYDSIRHVTVLFGGTIGNDTWEWDGVNWTLRNSTHTPPGRSFAAMAFDSARGKTVLFGGQGYPGGTFAQFGDTWEWDGTDWTQASPATSPVQRDNAAMAFDSARGVTVLFGGYSPVGYRLADTWEWNGTSWTQRTPATSPPARWGHTMVYDTVEHATVIYAGAGDSGTLGDTWAFDGTNWSQAGVTGNTPAARNYQGMAFDAGRGVSVMFGGYAIGVGDFADTWTAGFSVPAPVPAPSVTSRQVSVTEGASSQLAVATVSGGQSPLSGTIDWGDGTSSTASISGSSVAGTHLYSEEGSYTVTTTVSDARGMTASGKASAAVGDAALTLSGINIGVSKKESFVKAVASFKDADPSAKTSDYTATINWGDGTATQAAGIGTLDGSTFYVAGSHTYTTKGSFTVMTRVADGGGSVATVTSTATAG